MLLSNDGSNTFSWPFSYQLTGWGASVDWEPLIGDFSGDGADDLMVRNRNGGAAAIAYNDGVGALTNTGYVAVLSGLGASPDWRPYVGQFGGGPESDLLLRNRLNGETIVLVRTGATFNWVGGYQLAGYGGSIDWEPLIGDFDGNGYDDLMVRNRNAGGAALALNNGNGTLTNNGYVAALSGLGASQDWRPLIGQFGGGPESDLMLRNRLNGELIVLLRSGATFNWVAGYQLAGWGGSTDWTPLIGDFTGDGTDDLLVRHVGGGTALATNNGNGTLTSVGYSTGPSGIGASAAWKPLVGRFRIWDTSWQYGGGDHRVNSDGEADAVIAATRSRSDADAPAFFNGLSPDDRTYVSQRAAATIPSSAQYGGANLKVDGASEADAFVAGFHIAGNDAAANASYQGLAPVDRAYVDARLAVSSADPILFRDVASGAVWDVEDGGRFWVSSAEAATAMGYDLATARRTTAGALGTWPRGADITAAEGSGTLTEPGTATQLGTSWVAAKVQSFGFLDSSGAANAVGTIRWYHGKFPVSFRRRGEFSSARVNAVANVGCMWASVKWGYPLGSLSWPSPSISNGDYTQGYAYKCRSDTQTRPASITFTGQAYAKGGLHSATVTVCVSSKKSDLPAWCSNQKLVYGWS